MSPVCRRCRFQRPVMLVSAVNDGLVVVKGGAPAKYTGRVDALACVDVLSLAAIGELHVNLGVNFVFDLSKLLCREKSTVFLRLC